MSKEKTIKKRIRSKVSATLLAESDLSAIGKLHLESGTKESIILRGLVRVGIIEMEKKKISTLELIKLGAY